MLKFLLASLCKLEKRTWVKVFRIFPDFRILRLTLHINSRGARDSKVGKKWPESSRILDYILS